MVICVWGGGMKFFQLLEEIPNFQRHSSVQTFSAALNQNQEVSQNTQLYFLSLILQPCGQSTPSQLGHCIT